MHLLSIIRSSLFQLISILFVLGYLLGALNLHFSDKNDYCAMTFMFEYPQLVHLSVPENKKFPQYGLYAYSEGRLTERARKMWFDGVPVLYLPGNAGSHMQARSLASVALRKAMSKGYDYHFDFFTINYNEELSGLYGGVLHRQTEFALACVTKILSLYKNNKYTKSVPTTVILIGHSMGGLIAKRLLAYPGSINTTNIAITLAAPLESPVISFDIGFNNYYKHMEYEWETNINNDAEMKKKKLVISLGNGPRDVLVPPGLTSSKDSHINALTTAVPGVWVSPDHVSIVWCKQLVMAINRYLFSIVDPYTEQVLEDHSMLMARAKQYFQANRSMILSPEIKRGNVTMVADAFWYEDNRRIYQISRPEIDKMTYLMIRLVSFPQNRFVAVEAVNVDDKDWIFGCSAQYTYHMHRYCKQATSLTELSRWTGAATDFGKRKLATVHLHSIKDAHPEWSHVVVKVSPTRKPIILNVDINDHASRQIQVHLPSGFSFGKTIIKAETEPESLYYELILQDFNAIYQAYMLYVEPTAGCKATQYHVSAEVHVPWAENHEYYHYFTQAKRSPMRLRLYKSNPNITLGLDTTEHVKVTLLLDPQCTYTISISTSWYLQLAQFARNYTPVLIPYMAAILLLAARSCINNIMEHGSCISIHKALISDEVKPYYVLVFARLTAMGYASIPLFMMLYEDVGWKNLEMQYFIKSLLVIPAYMIALGILNIAAIVVVGIMVFSSQIAHRLLFRIVWRGGNGFAEKVAYGLQKVPMVVSAALVAAVPLSCGAASLAAGAAFYAFMLSKMYEEYLEDYVYKLIAKIASRICRVFKKTKERTEESQNLISTTNLAIKQINTTSESESKNVVISKNEQTEMMNQNKKLKDTKVDGKDGSKNSNKDCPSSENKEEVGMDEDLNNLNFHMMMFFLWLAVTVANIPALLTWARNFPYSISLQPDTSWHTGILLSFCSTCLWQMDGPRKNLKHYDFVSSLLFVMAVFILALGPISGLIVNYGVALLFAIITLQQVCDVEIKSNNVSEVIDDDVIENDDTRETECDDTSDKDNACNENTSNTDKEETTEPCDNNASNVPSESCDECSESRIYNMFKTLREKLSFNNEDV